MKTTIDIPDSLLQRVKKMAGKRKTTLKAIIETALREALSAENQPRERFRLKTHTYGGNGLQAGFSWDDWSAIRDMSYEGRGG